MFASVFLILFLVPSAVLCWRIVVTKSRRTWLRAGAAAAAMINAVGAFIVYDDLSDFEFRDWRSDVALAAAMSGSLYLLGWSLRHRSNRRHRSLSLVAALIGLVPVIGTIATTLLFRE